MNKLEPTYLRYIHDELNKGSISSDNASSIPHGFVGLFEKSFSSDIPLTQRSSTLRRLCLWALLKKAVSSEFVSEVLKENIDSTKVLIDTYSKWFNSPEPGKYVLFHDRLRSYLIQKLSDHEVQRINEQLIAYLEQSLESFIGEESELYALEHLSTHMAVESGLDNNYERLHDFVNREELWARQIKVSNEYKWSQKGVQYGIKEGARRHYEMNTLTSTINSVKLIQEERDSLKQILNLIISEDYLIGLSRLERIPKNKILKLILLIIHELIFTDYFDLKRKKEVLSSTISILDKIEESNIELSHNKMSFYSNYGKYPCELILIYILELKKLEINFNPLIEKTRISGADLISLIENDGFCKLNDGDFKSILNIISDKFHQIIIICLLIKRTYLKKTSTSQSVINHIDFQSISNPLCLMKNDKGSIETGVYSHQNEFKSINIDYEYLNERFLNHIKIVFEDYNYFNNLYKEDKSVDNLNFKYNPLDEIFDTIINYSFLTTIDVNILDLIELKIDNYNHSRKFIAILIKLDKFKRAQNFIESSERTDKFDLKSSNHRSYDKDYCHILIKNHRLNINRTPLKSTLDITDVFFKALYFLGIADNYLDNGNVSDAKKYFAKSEDQIPTWKDYQNGLKFGIIFLRKHLTLISVYISFLIKLDDDKNISKYMDLFLKINSLNSHRYFKDNSNIKRDNYVNYVGLLTVLFKSKLNLTLTDKIILNFKKSISETADHFNDLKSTINSLPDEIYLDFINIFIEVGIHGNYPKSIILNLAYRHFRTFKDFILFLKTNAGIKVSEGLLDILIFLLENGDYDQIIIFILMNKKICIQHLKKVLPFEKFKQAEKAILTCNSFKTELSFNSLDEKPLSIKKIENPDTNSNIKKVDFNEKYFENFHKESNEIIELIEKLNIQTNIERRSFLTPQNTKKLLMEIDSFDINKKSILALPLIGILYSLDIVNENKIIDKTDRLKLFYSISLSCLIDIETDLSKGLRDKISWKFNNLKLNINKTFDLLKNVLLDLLLLLPQRDMGDYGLVTSDIIEIVNLFIKEDKVDLILQASYEAKNIFDKLNKKTFSNPITGVIMPRDVCFIVWEEIFNELLKNKYYEEALSFSKLMQENNKIARFKLIYMLELASTDSNKAKSFISEVIELIEKSDDIPIDHNIYSFNHEWPEKGHSFLRLADFCSKTNDPELSCRFIKRSLDEINLKYKNIEIENLDLNSSMDYNTRINQQNLDFFKYKCICEFIKIDLVDDAISLSNTMNINTVHELDAFFSSSNNFEGGKTLEITSYAKSRKEIANYFFNKLDVDKAVSFLLGDNKISIIAKIYLVKNMLFNLNYFEFNKLYHFFSEEDLKSFFVSMLFEKIEFSKKSLSDFMFLSKFGIGMSEGHYNSVIQKDLFMKYVGKKAQRVIDSGDDPSINILSNVYNII